MHESDMKKLLLQYINKLSDIDVQVLVDIDDQGSNINLFETELGLSIEKPFFTVNEKQIFIMYDPPHLVKNVRNNMKKHGFKIKEKVISWQHIKDF